MPESGLSCLIAACTGAARCRSESHCDTNWKHAGCSGQAPAADNRPPGT